MSELQLGFVALACCWAGKQSGMHSPGMHDSAQPSWGCVVTAGWSFPPVHQETADMAMVAISALFFGDQTRLKGFLLPKKLKTLCAT